MKTQIRKGAFETNSSSTHSICISKEPVGDVKDRHIDFDIGEFGWQFDTADTADYLYTAILCQENYVELLDRLKTILDESGVHYTMKEPLDKTWKDDLGYVHHYLEYGYVDHDEDLRDFIEAVLSDKDLLFRYLFDNDSVVYTGNDNDGIRPDTNGQARDEVWDVELCEYVPNPYHDENKYDYFYKEN